LAQVIAIGGLLPSTRFVASKVLFASLLVAGAALAQTSGGVFKGEVRDASSAIIPHAKISIRSNDNGTEAVAESNGEGL